MHLIRYRNASKRRHPNGRQTRMTGTYRWCPILFGRLERIASSRIQGSQFAFVREGPHRS
ncbi:MAG: hypothetical protein CMM07_21825 [Rhodopirellula sp.]|nr:hypothetical protein [Rhodopirellula sp.]